jgi:hypothetical protein
LPSGAGHATAPDYAAVINGLPVAARTINDIKLESARPGRESNMSALKATGFFLLGMLAGLGVALVIAAQPLDLGGTVSQIGPVNIFQAGVLLLVIGLVGCIEVARSPRSRRLRTIMAGIALLAVLLAVSVGLRRRAERFGELQSHYQKRYQKPNIVPDDPEDESWAPLLRLHHWYNVMSDKYGRAAARPWLPVPPPKPCDCHLCDKSGVPESESEWIVILGENVYRTVRERVTGGR